ncbi:katanin p60 ATPase-containing subunit A1 [Nematocida parisii]|nr:katanin p60 ATPase-containing subunit A1 [Nematocida parisii]KAI5130254.1 katanin p60 ATPase-containing subunit A1 [Nematocida parisii]KAI5143456.1 katanin p60 ATPase-containing subunit A1 [Nematocida parisii]KAI5155088.1 katanin p60 ATPase-containing subunit A1 [Nematocida parisii]
MKNSSAYEGEQSKNFLNNAHIENSEVLLRSMEERRTKSTNLTNTKEEDKSIIDMQQAVIDNADVADGGDKDANKDEDLKKDENENEDEKNKKNKEQEADEPSTGRNFIPNRNNAQQTSPMFAQRGMPAQNRRPPVYPNMPPKAPLKSPISLQTIATIIMIIFFSASLYFLFKTHGGQGGMTNGASKKDSYFMKNFDELADRYRRLKPSQCKQSAYYGLDEQFNSYIKLILPYIEGGENSASLCGDRMLTKNLMVYGMPGTGKSFFARKLFLLTALNIKAEKLKKKYLVKNLNIKNKKNAHSIIRELYDCDDTIELYQIDSGMFLNKLVGESEEAFRVFKEFIEWRQKTIPVFVFIDEAESVFSTRKSSDTGGGGQIALNLKTMWLTWLDGIQAKEESRKFLIAATNFYESIDDALKRRFESKLGIPLSVKSDRKTLLEKELFKTKVVDVRDRVDKNKILAETEGIQGNDMMKIVYDLKKKKNSTKTPVSLKKALNHIQKHKKILNQADAEKKEKDKMYKKHQIHDDTKMSNPDSIITTLHWEKTDSIPVTKQEMMSIEEELAMQTEIDIKENEDQQEIMAGLGISLNHDDRSSDELKGSSQDSDSSLEQDEPFNEGMLTSAGNWLAGVLAKISS